MICQAGQGNQQKPRSMNGYAGSGKSMRLVGQSSGGTMEKSKPEEAVGGGGFPKRRAAPGPEPGKATTPSLGGGQRKMSRCARRRKSLSTAPREGAVGPPQTPPHNHPSVGEPRTHPSLTSMRPCWEMRPSCRTSWDLQPAASVTAFLFASDTQQQ